MVNFVHTLAIYNILDYTYAFHMKYCHAGCWVVNNFFPVCLFFVLEKKYWIFIFFIYFQNCFFMVTLPYRRIFIYSEYIWNCWCLILFLFIFILLMNCCKSISGARVNILVIFFCTKYYKARIIYDFLVDINAFICLSIHTYI